jgi:hypothetical protein
VCEVDPTCCAQVWDQQCADLADARCNQCGLTDASCLEPHDTAGCNDQTCCDLVCKFDPSCCSVRWDANCADLAADDPRAMGTHARLIALSRDRAAVRARPAR